MSIVDNAKQDKYQRCVDEYLGNVYRYARACAHRFQSDIEEAQVAAQEAFVRLWDHMDEAQGHELPYLLKIVTNHFLQARRRSRDHPEISLSLETGRGRTLESTIPDPKPESNPINIVLRDESYKVLRECIDCLPKMHRDVLTLKLERFRGGDLNEQNIGCRLGISVALVKYYFYMAKRRLAECFTEKGYDYAG